MAKLERTKEERANERARERAELLERIRAATEAADKLSGATAEPAPALVEPVPQTEPAVEPTPSPLPPPLPKIEATPPPLPEPILKETDTKNEIKNVSTEDREKIGWGLSTIGFKVEKTKNDFFADALEKPLSKIDKKGTTGRFLNELKKTFVRDSKDAEKKAKDITSKKEKHRIANVGLLAGNVLKYGRMVADITGASIANPLRYVMMGGMVGARMSEAGKEARLKNEEVIEQTRIQDVEKAYDEAMKIYEDAIRSSFESKTGEIKMDESRNAIVSANELKKAYMMRMPKDLQERLENPSTANSFIQKILKNDIGGALTRLNNSIEKIENNHKLSKEQKTLETEKLLTKQKKNLEDYDRIITQYGTVDGLAMAGRYAEKTSKAIVLGMQIETALVSAEKLWGTVSNIFHHFHDTHEVLTSHIPAPQNAPASLQAMHGAAVIETHSTLEPISAHTAPTPLQAIHGATVAETIHAPTPSVSPAINNFANEGIKFEHGKGGIQGVLDLKKQIIAQYNGDYSKAPASVQEFMDTDATKEAIKLGLYDPNNPNESALIRAGSVLKFDEHGNILFGKPDASGNIPILEKYHGSMFDSDGSEKMDLNGKVLVDTKIPQIPNIDDAKIDLNDSIKNAELNEPYVLETHAPSPSTAPEHTVLDETTRTPFDAQGHEKSIETAREEVFKKMELKPGKYRTGSTVETGSFADTGNPAFTGSPAFTGLSQNHFYGNYGQTLHDLSQEYPNNPLNLSGESLRQVSSDVHKDIEFFWGEKSSTWNRLSHLTVKDVLAKTDKGPADKHLEDYLNLLKKYSGVGTKNGWFTQKKAGDYIVEAWQKLAAGQGKVSIGKMEEIVAAEKNKY